MCSILNLSEFRTGKHFKFIDSIRSKEFRRRLKHCRLEREWSMVKAVLV